MAKFGPLTLSAEDKATLDQLKLADKGMNSLLEMASKAYDLKTFEGLIPDFLNFQRDNPSLKQNMNTALEIILLKGDPKIETGKITDIISKKLTLVIDKIPDAKSKKELQRIVGLLNADLIGEALAAFNKVTPLGPTAAELSVLQDQLRLITKNKSPEELEIKNSKIINEIDQLKAAIKAYQEETEAQKMPLLRKGIYERLDNFLGILENSSHTATREYALRQLIPVFAFQEPKWQALLAQYRERNKENTPKTFVINVLNSVAKSEGKLFDKHMLFANFFLNPNLSPKDREYFAPFLLANFNVDTDFALLNHYIDLTEDKNLKLQLAKQALDILLSMIATDTRNQKFPLQSLYSPSPSLEAFFARVNALDPTLQINMRQALSRTIEAQEKRSFELMNSVKIPSTNRSLIDIEHFFKSRLPKLSSNDAEYKNALQSAADTLFYLQESLFLTVHPSDFHDWGKPTPESNVKQLIKVSDMLGFFLRKSITESPDVKSKQKVANFFIDLMYYALEKRDFQTAYSIFAALNQARQYDPLLKADTPSTETIMGIKEQPKFKEAYEKSMAKAKLFFDFGSNMKNYRAPLRQVTDAKLVHIPVFQIMMKDIKAIDEGEFKDPFSWIDNRSKYYGYIKTLVGLYEQELNKNRLTIGSTLGEVVMRPVTVVSAPAKLETTSHPREEEKMTEPTTRPEPLLRQRASSQGEGKPPNPPSRLITHELPAFSKAAQSAPSTVSSSTTAPTSTDTSSTLEPSATTSAPPTRKWVSPQRSSVQHPDSESKAPTTALGSRKPPKPKGSLGT